MHQTCGKDANLEPIVITYNDSVAITDLACIAKTSAGGSTDFIKGSFYLFNKMNSSFFFV